MLKHLFFILALHGNMETVSYLLDNCDITVDTRDSCGSTPLMDALKSGHVTLAQLLIERQKVVDVFRLTKWVSVFMKSVFSKELRYRLIQLHM